MAWWVPRCSWLTIRHSKPCLPGTVIQCHQSPTFCAAARWSKYRSLFLTCNGWLVGLVRTYILIFGVSFHNHIGPTCKIYFSKEVLVLATDTVVVEVAAADVARIEIERSVNQNILERLMCAMHSIVDQSWPCTTWTIISRINWWWTRKKVPYIQSKYWHCKASQDKIKRSVFLFDGRLVVFRGQRSR